MQLPAKKEKTNKKARTDIREDVCSCLQNAADLFLKVRQFNGFSFVLVSIECGQNICKVKAVQLGLRLEMFFLQIQPSFRLVNRFVVLKLSLA